MTNYYQPVDCTTNKWAKEFMKNKFSTWYTKGVHSELVKGTSIKDINIKFPLTMMKPLHANWIIQLYNELASEGGKNFIHGYWVRSGIFDAIMLESKNLPSLDPFEETEPLDSECTIIDVPHSESTSKYENQQQMRKTGASLAPNGR